MTNPIFTKEDYVKKQEENITKEIKEKENFRRIAYLSIALPAVLALAGYLLKDKINLPKLSLSDIPYLLLFYESFPVLAICSSSKDIKELKSKKVEIPTDEQMANYITSTFLVKKPKKKGK